MPRYLEITLPLNYERAKRVMSEAGVDAIIASSPANVFYASDYNSAGVRLGCGTYAYVLVPLDSDPSIIAPLSEVDLVVESGASIKDVRYYGCLHAKSLTGKGSSETTKLIGKALEGPVHKTSCDALAEVVVARGLANKKISFDMEGITHGRYENIKKKLPNVNFSDCEDMLVAIRTVKTSEEIERIGRATEITEKAMEDALEISQDGITEVDMAGIYAYSIAEDRGRVTQDYIGSGERSAYPNPVPSNKPLEKGDLIRLTLGATYMGYNSNVSRAAVLGKSSAETEKKLKAVIDAQEVSFDAIKPGVKFSEIYLAAQKELNKAGIKNCSINLGHSLGVTCNEKPLITSNEASVIVEGMVLNIDVPYLELGWGGIELEDTILIGKKGIKLLTNTERTLYLL